MAHFVKRVVVQLARANSSLVSKRHLCESTTYFGRPLSELTETQRFLVEARKAELEDLAALYAQKEKTRQSIRRGNEYLVAELRSTVAYVFNCVTLVVGVASSCAGVLLHLELRLRAVKAAAESSSHDDHGAK